jgi:hypothetical protein
MPLDQKTIDGLDPGIRKTVVWMNTLGYETTDSGDGKTKPAQGLTLEDGVRPEAHVCIPFDREDQMHWYGWVDRLMWHMRALSISVVPVGHPDGVWLQMTYDPVTGRAILDVVHLDDERLLSALKGPR